MVTSCANGVKKFAFENSLWYIYGTEERRFSLKFYRKGLKMNRYKLFTVITWHPRPLASGGFAGEKREIPFVRRFTAMDDIDARLRIPSLLNPKPSLPPTPRRSERIVRLSEVDSKGVEIRNVHL